MSLHTQRETHTRLYQEDDGTHHLPALPAT